MSRVRNAVIIIILCIIGAYSVKKAPQLGLSLPGTEDIKDAVAGGPSQRRGNGNPQLTLASGKGEDLRDAVAGHAVGTPGGSNTLGDVGGPPRGNGYGGFGPLSTNNNNNPPNNPPPSLSPSGPNDALPSNPCEGNGPASIQNQCND